MIAGQSDVCIVSTILISIPTKNFSDQRLVTAIAVEDQDPCTLNYAMQSPGDCVGARTTNSLIERLTDDEDK